MKASFIPALFAIMATVVSATPANMDARAVTDNCQNALGNCYENGCSGAFNNPSDTVGHCTQGTFNGCPCEKCGVNNGRCGENGCNGVQGHCTSGSYQGCPCS